MVCCFFEYFTKIRGKIQMNKFFGGTIYMKKKYLFITLCLSCMLLLSACGNKNDTTENKDPLTGEEITEDNTTNTTDENVNTWNGDFTEYDTMLADENTDPNDIMDYINTNIVSAAANDVEYFFKGLLGFGNDIRDLDFTSLEASRQYMPEDMIAFTELMRLESDTPSMAMSDTENRKVINMTLSEMLERALLFEQHLEKYPDNVSTEAAQRLYEEIATNAISGGYNSTEGIAHYYQGDTNDVVDSDAIQYYEQFVEANPNSNLAKVVEEYVTLLKTNQYQLNDNVEEFYKSLYSKLDIDTITENANAATSET
jgi:hypothetical protein